MTALVNKGDETTAVESTEGRRLNSRPLHRTVDESLLAEPDAPIAIVSCFMSVVVVVVWISRPFALFSPRTGFASFILKWTCVEDVVISEGLRTASYVNGIC